ncbi:MAG: FG-GAP-like repeat-containing protein [Bacteroidota bacterium]
MQRIGGREMALLTLGVLLAACGGTPGTQGPPAPAQASLAFTDVTEAAGLGTFAHVTGAAGAKWFPETMGSGGGFVDFDGDGWDDIVLLGGGLWDEADTWNGVWLYRNNQDGTFADVTAAYGVAGLKRYTVGLAAADYDGDGDHDLYITALGPNIMLRNDGHRFTDVSEASGAAGPYAWSTSAVFFDADRDGAPDLHVGNYVDWTPETDLWCTTDGTNKAYCTPESYTASVSHFYRNNGDGTFTDASDATGFGRSAGKNLGAVPVDYNGDGWTDLLVANDTNPDELFRNNGDGTFAEVGALSGIAYDERGRARAGMGIDVGDVDGSGNVTMVVGNFVNEMIGVYRYTGRDLFLDRAAASRMGSISLRTLTFGLFLADLDLDMDLDLIAANGHIHQEIEKVQDNITYRQATHLFLNDGRGQFVDIAPDLGAPLTNRLVSRGAAYSDIDHDGDLDILITENEGPAHVWRNDLRTAADQATPSFLAIDVRDASGHEALGARVDLFAEGQRQVRWIRGGGSYLSQSSTEAAFGLGTAAQVDSVVVTWPQASGPPIVARFAEVAANQRLTITPDGLRGTP